MSSPPPPSSDTKYDTPRPNQTKFGNNVLGVLEDHVSNGRIEMAAIIIVREHLVILAIPMYCKVWFICLLGKIYLQIGQWRKALE